MPGSALQSLDEQSLLPELSRVLRLEEIQSAAATIVVDANARECAGLASRFELTYVRNLSAEVTYRRLKGGQMIRLEGRISANYGQLCTSTEMPMAMVMEESFQTEYTLEPWEKYSEFDLDQPEVLTDDFLDIGEVVAQYFGLGIDPYARRAGAERLEELTEAIAETARELLETTEAPIAPSGPLLAEMPDYSEQAAAMTVNQDIEMPEMAMTESAPEVQGDFLPEEPPQSESLFFKYLRQIRAG